MFFALQNLIFFHPFFNQYTSLDRSFMQLSTLARFNASPSSFANWCFSISTHFRVGFCLTILLKCAASLLFMSGFGLRLLRFVSLSFFPCNGSWCNMVCDCIPKTCSSYRFRIFTPHGSAIHGQKCLQIVYETTFNVFFSINFRQFISIIRIFRFRYAIDPSMHSKYSTHVPSVRGRVTSSFEQLK